MNYIVDPGFEEWTILPRARGRARISAAGDGAASGLPSRLFRVVVIVR